MTTQGNWPNKLSQIAGKHQSQAIHPYPQGNEGRGIREFLGKSRDGKKQRESLGLRFNPMSIHHFFLPTHPPKNKIYNFGEGGGGRGKTGAESPSTHMLVLQNYYPKVIMFYRCLALLFPLLSHRASLIISPFTQIWIMGLMIKIIF